MKGNSEIPVEVEFLGSDPKRLQVMRRGIFIERVRCGSCLDQLMGQAIDKGVDVVKTFRLRHLFWHNPTILDRILFRKRLSCEECGTRG